MQGIRVFEVPTPDYERLYKDQKHYVRILERLTLGLLIVICYFAWCMHGVLA